MGETVGTRLPPQPAEGDPGLRANAPRPHFWPDEKAREKLEETAAYQFSELSAAAHDLGRALLEEGMLWHLATVVAAAPSVLLLSYLPLPGSLLVAVPALVLPFFVHSYWRIKVRPYSGPDLDVDRMEELADYRLWQVDEAFAARLGIDFSDPLDTPAAVCYDSHGNPEPEAEALGIATGPDVVDGESGVGISLDDAEVDTGALRSSLERTIGTLRRFTYVGPAAPSDDDRRISIG